MTPANERVVAEICVELDGLPLAIELAAARIKLLSPQALLSRLSQRFQVLTSATQNIPARHQTLHSTIKWSYELLGANEQRLFRQLAVFAGGWTAQAAEAVCSVDTTLPVLDLISSLLDKSLLLRTERESEVDTEPRLSMLVSVREFGLENLRESEEWDSAHRAYAAYYLALAEEAERNLEGAGQLEWLARLEQEYKNLRAALRWLIEVQATEEAWRLCCALTNFWLIRGNIAEGVRWAELALALPYAGGATKLRARMLCCAGQLVYLSHDNSTAFSYLEESVAFFRRSGDRQELSAALDQLGYSCYESGDAQRGYGLLAEGLALSRTNGTPSMLASVLRNLGVVERERNNFAQARSYLTESVALYRKAANELGLARALAGLAFLEVREGNLAKAVQWYEESLPLSRKLGDRQGLAETLNLLGSMVKKQGDEVRGNSYVAEALAVARETGDKEEIAQALGYKARQAVERGDLDQAAMLAWEGLALRRETGMKGVISYQLNQVGRIVRDQGDRARAVALFREGVTLAQEIGWHTEIAWNLLGLASIACLEIQPVQAARLLGAAQGLLDRQMDFDQDDRAEHDRLAEQLRAQLSDAALAAALAEGRKLTPEQALALAAPTSAAKTAAQASAALSTPAIALRPTYPDDLTPREVEVLHLLARGWTDAQIAEHLVISPRTVNRHTSSIYDKIGVSSRSAAVRYAIDKKLA